jgi:hypothetical protein
VVRRGSAKLHTMVQIHPHTSITYCHRRLVKLVRQKKYFCGLMDNPALLLAQAYVDTTNTLVFLTGKAGTGKTTFLRQVRLTTTKRLAIVAPTGVAAINAGGMTIHSMFQLPFGPMPPDLPERPELKYNQDKRVLLESLELLVIDEISMVRPDVLDQIDLILRNVRGSRHPFGGVQLLLIGDLAQLSPIIREDEWSVLRPYYPTPYFFSSSVLQRTDYVRIELDKVYRQSDERFIRILNEMREQQLAAESLKELNARYIEGFRPDAGDPYITLTTHNQAARQINQEWLDAIDAPVTEYQATVRGEFPADAFPTDATLRLKVGAQVMFVKNDSSAEKRYYNGKIGTIVNLEAETVQVLTPEGNVIGVQALEWSNVRYQAHGEQVSEENAGSFAQIPLKTAWAITIHKSQGLTFDKAVIDVSAAFAHGQAYVALSRCRSLEGLVLLKPVSAANVIGDPAVARFNLLTASRQPDVTLLGRHQQAYRFYLLSELFNFSGFEQRLTRFEALLPNAQQDLVAVAVRLEKQLPGYADERIQKAAGYFYEKVTGTIRSLHADIPNHIGTAKETAGKADELLNWLMSRLQLLETFKATPFTTDTYLHLQRSRPPSRSGYLQALNARPNEKLIGQLMEWREQTARTENILASMLFTEQTLAAIAAKLPATLKAISGIKGVGTQKAARYGPQLIGLIRAYQQELAAPGTEQARLF